MKPLVVVGVGGGIAAYKVTRVVRELQHHDYAVRVIPTQAATHFVGDTTWHALSGQAVTTSVFDGG
ncbi:phosphopantothenoylcysteine decarboxylase, partial [Streptococcus anginosus]|nr:phosphopantothenoylcysteine decarboxylase [Streptococcus anginosus]